MPNPSISSPPADYGRKRLTRAQSKQLAWKLISDFWIPPASQSTVPDGIPVPPASESRALQARNGNLCD